MRYSLGFSRELVILIIFQGISHAYCCFSLFPHDPREAFTHSIKGAELLKDIGELWELLCVNAFKALSGVCVGRSLYDYLDNAEELMAIAYSVNARQVIAWAHMNKAKSLALLGDERLKTQGVQAAEEGIRTSEKLGNKPCNLWAHAVLAFVHLRAANYDKAVEMADRCAKLYPACNPNARWALDLFPICTEVYLESLRCKPNLGEKEKKVLLNRARRFCWCTRFKAKLFPFIRGWAYQVTGTCQWLTGKKRRP